MSSTPDAPQPPPLADPHKVFRVAATHGRTDETIEIKYTNYNPIGAGCFGFVYQARLLDVPKDEEDIAIKRIMQDRKYKNRELQIMREISHPNIVELKSFFYDSGDKKDEVYLNLVLEFMPETLYRTMRNYVRMRALMPPLCTKLCTYQLLRALAHLHALGVCHRDIKPHNVLHNPATGVLKIIDFGSAKALVAGRENVSYICSRYYRAPELLFGSTRYTHSVDIWSAGCVMAEIMLGHIMFPGQTSIDQLVEVIKVLGTPSKDDVRAMNPAYTDHKFPAIKAQPMHKVFRPGTSSKAMELVAQLLTYNPNARLGATAALAHPYFDELRAEGKRLPNGRPFPQLFNFSRAELSVRPDLLRKLVPPQAEAALRARGVDIENFEPIDLDEIRVDVD